MCPVCCSTAKCGAVCRSSSTLRTACPYAPGRPTPGSWRLRATTTSSGAQALWLPECHSLWWGRRPLGLARTSCCACLGLAPGTAQFLPALGSRSAEARYALWALRLLAVGFPRPPRPSLALGQEPAGAWIGGSRARGPADRVRGVVGPDHLATARPAWWT